MNKAETVIDFRKHVNKLLDEGEKKSWIEAESELANKTLTQILEWGEGPELIPMKASTLAKLQDFNKKVAMGGLIKYPAVKAKRGRPKKEGSSYHERLVEKAEVKPAENIDEGYDISADSFFGNHEEEIIKLKDLPEFKTPHKENPIAESFVNEHIANNVIDKPSSTRHKLTPEEMEQIKKDLGLYVGLDDPDLTIDKAIVLLNRACKKSGVACEVVIKSA
jgi:hypothetical protein